MGRPDELGNGDLYISFRKQDGGWSKAENMGSIINSKEMELFASVSPDGKYLFFTSDREGSNNVYWIDAKVIDDFKPGKKSIK